MTETETPSTPCDSCGINTHGYTHSSNKWLCGKCSLQERSDITEVIGNGAICECGVATKFKYSDRERWVCPVCLEVFTAEECPICDRPAKILTLTDLTRLCKRCLEDRQ